MVTCFGPWPTWHLLAHLAPCLWSISLRTKTLKHHCQKVPAQWGPWQLDAKATPTRMHSLPTLGLTKSSRTSCSAPGPAAPAHLPNVPVSFHLQATVDSASAMGRLCPSAWASKWSSKPHVPSEQTGGSNLFLSLFLHCLVAHVCGSPQRTPVYGLISS